MKHQYLNLYSAMNYIDKLYTLFEAPHAFELVVLLLSIWLDDGVIDVDDHACLRDYNRKCRKALEV